MRIFVVCVITSCLLWNCSGQQKQTISKSPQSKNSIILDSIITIAKNASLYKDAVNWPQLEKELFEMLGSNDSLNTLKAPIQQLFTALGDHHGFATIEGEQIKGNVVHKRTVDYEYNTQKYYNNTSAMYRHYLEHPEVITTMLEGQIAYIQIPQVINNSGEQNINLEVALNIRNKICALIQEQPKGYIIDLRANLGGNMYPMFCGLGPLFPNTLAGGDTKDGKTFHSQWQFKDGNFYYDAHHLDYIPELNCSIGNNNPAIAILISRYTSSSGEALASGLKGLPNTKLFGETTSGFSTSNSWMLISDDVAFNPAVAIYMSQDKTVHKDGVIPEVYISENFDFKSPYKGKVIDTAKTWIFNSLK